MFTYSYDAANRLITVTNGLTATGFTYNGLGVRVAQNDGGVVTTYTVDQAGGLTQVLADGTNTYLYGNGRIAQYTGASAQYFLPDALGSVRQLADATGAVTLARSYEPFGSTLSSVGTGTTSYGFTGEWTNAQTGLIDLRARQYSPGMGRFVSKDSWAGSYSNPLSLNGWLYTEDSPMNFTDRSGHIMEGSDANLADRFIRELNISYGVVIDRDYGLFANYTRCGPNGTRWYEGAWKSSEELFWVLEAVTDAATRMGYADKFKSAMHNSVKIVRLGIPPTSFPIIGPIRPFAPPSGTMLGDVALPDYVFNNGERYAKYSVVHELGHVWDRRTGLQLSQGMMRKLNTELCVWAGSDFRCFFEMGTSIELPPGDKDPAKNYAGTSAMEDWAEAFASVVYPNYYGPGSNTRALRPIRQKYVEDQIAAIP